MALRGIPRRLTASVASFCGALYILCMMELMEFDPSSNEKNDVGLGDENAF